MRVSEPFCMLVTVAGSARLIVATRYWPWASDGATDGGRESWLSLDFSTEMTVRAAVARCW